MWFDCSLECFNRSNDSLLWSVEVGSSQISGLYWILQGDIMKDEKCMCRDCLKDCFNLSFVVIAIFKRISYRITTYFCTLSWWIRMHIGMCMWRCAVQVQSVCIYALIDQVEKWKYIPNICPFDVIQISK